MFSRNWFCPSVISSSPAIRDWTPACILYTFVPDPFASNESFVSDRRLSSGSSSFVRSFDHSKKDSSHKLGTSGGRNELIKYNDFLSEELSELNRIVNALARGFTLSDFIPAMNSDIEIKLWFKDAAANSTSSGVHVIPVIRLRQCSLGGCLSFFWSSWRASLSLKIGTSNLEVDLVK